ncbi:hypothetical protein CWO07_26875 [Vibrio splendidus]|uniref:Uncharacterized protein n=1 Tax=Vibrio splendidus TaxID=29497 RepID=A0A2T5DWG0_VIBSP|nr:hypothetical protein OAS_03425 [Vibrio cyclitrophicus ZF65]PMJ49764.1 hypothetical protein BCU23_03775 [Vibrio splendidus]PTP11420.1 hypothetical protein CWO07_26875 [Vibrio splendidus]
MSSQALALSKYSNNVNRAAVFTVVFYVCRPKRQMTTRRTEEEEEGAQREAGNRPQLAKVHYL